VVLMLLTGARLGLGLLILIRSAPSRSSRPCPLLAAADRSRRRNVPVPSSNPGCGWPGPRRLGTVATVLLLVGPSPDAYLARWLLIGVE
jgi:hypothetical protein